MKLLCLGDVAIGEDVILDGKWLPPGNIKPSADEKIVFNWELPIGERVKSGIPCKHPRLSVNPQTIRIFEKWSPGFATLATNHMMDSGVDGLKKTILELESIGIQPMGAGFSQESISEPCFWETNEGRLSIVNWVFPETNPDWMVVPGVNCWPGLGEAKKTINELREKSNWIILFLHWSDELFYYPRPEDRKTAYELASLGVDAIIGHHPHVVRGFEVIGSCPIFYSLGNYFFSDFQNLKGQWLRQAPLNRQSLGISLTFQRGQQPTFKTISFIQLRGRALLDINKRSELRLEKLSVPLRELEGNQYEIWYKKKKSHFLKWEAKWEFGVRKLGLLGVLRYAGQYMMDRFPFPFHMDWLL